MCADLKSVGDKSDGILSIADCFCLCLGNNDQDENIENWIICKGCENWYHRKCNFISDGQYDRIMEDGWYCSNRGCQKLFSLNSVKNNGDRPVRQRLIRKCKGKSVTYSSEVTAEDISDRISCEECGFLAKNSHGLKIHMSKHKRANIVDDLIHFEVKENVDDLNVADVLEDFGLLLNKCRVSVPLTRIIQKSVRTAVCQELARVIEKLDWIADWYV